MPEGVRVLLVNPDTPYLRIPRMRPMLGILYIAAAIRQWAGVEPLLWDMNYDSNPPVEETDILMVTANTGTWKAACTARERVQHKLSVIGGPHVTALGHQSPFDVSILGEGESKAAALVSEFPKIGPACAPKPLAIDTIPWPAYDLWPDLGQEFAVAAEGIEVGRGTAIITSRGCPYSCHFCSSAVLWGRQVRFRDMEDVLAEVFHLRDRYGITQIILQDDTVNLDKPRFARLCRGLHELGVLWRAQTRTDQVTLDELRMMKDCGCIEVGYGVESGSQRMLDLMGKKNDVATHGRAIRWANEIGLHSRVYLVVGFPGETWESIFDTLDFLQETRPHRAIVNSFVPYPGSAVWNKPEAFNCSIERSTDWGAYRQQELAPDEGFPCSFPSMTREALFSARALVQLECERLFGSVDRRLEVS